MHDHFVCAYNHLNGISMFNYKPKLDRVSSLLHANSHRTISRPDPHSIQVYFENMHLEFLRFHLNLYAFSICTHKVRHDMYSARCTMLCWS